MRVECALNAHWMSSVAGLICHRKFGPGEFGQAGHNSPLGLVGNLVHSKLLRKYGPLPREFAPGD